MLNTDLHNTAIAKNKKMTLGQFILNNQRIDKNITVTFCTDIYHKIKKQPITMNDEDMFESAQMTFIGPSKAGWLQKLVQWRITIIIIIIIIIITIIYCNNRLVTESSTRVYFPVSQALVCTQRQLFILLQKPQRENPSMHSTTRWSRSHTEITTGNHTHRPRCR
jgi:hypothetical protein